ncbi:MAG: hypothetical protein PHZ04_02360 [Patescibacteria group bacterium]|nr:hypothetical protein [Patescibacteria group bacterium]MDD5295028.1 hypothetical protein [Patescibacteria group bacterium]MDD5554158.1 hypothetical protein [Patescibacteria group bacterium]
MKDVTPKDTRYIPFTQQPWCCVPTCILMIMYRHHIPLISQELLGYYLGLIVPQKDRKYFWRVAVGKRPPAGYGTRSYLKIYEPNKALKRLKIPLEIKFHPIDKFKNINDFSDFLIKAEKQNKDILACFNYKKLYGQGNDGGHLSVVDRVYLKGSKVRLIDPGGNEPKWRLVSITELKKAMEGHYYKSARFWEFKLMEK